MKTKLAEFTTEQAAAILQKTPEQIQTLCRMGLLDAVKACGTWRIYDLQIQGEAQPTKPRRTQRRATPPRTLARLEVEPVEAAECKEDADASKIQKARRVAARWRAAAVVAVCAACVMGIVLGIAITTAQYTIGAF